MRNWRAKVSKRKEAVGHQGVGEPSLVMSWFFNCFEWSKSVASWLSNSKARIIPQDPASGMFFPPNPTTNDLLRHWASSLCLSCAWFGVHFPGRLPTVFQQTVLHWTAIHGRFWQIKHASLDVAVKFLAVVAATGEHGYHFGSGFRRLHAMISMF